MKSPAITRIREVVDHFSYTSGTCEVPAEFCKLYYQSSPDSGDAKWLNMANASKEQLSDLISTCDAAPFGRGHQTVYDNSYRKALKLELSQFATPFELAGTIIPHQIQRDLVDTDTALRRQIRFEPYKLNIYDEGAFFKPHKDTPRRENMFGSLVVVFPTEHQGGDLILADGKHDWTFKASDALKNSTPDHPEIAFVAFYSDVTHEVLPVTSGARITLTYNLYFESTSLSNAPVSAEISDQFEVVKSAMIDLMAEPRFKANSTLCFGLAHRYPVTSRPNKKRDKHGKSAYYTAKELSQYLKGSDALLYRACEAAGLVPSLKVLYDLENYDWRTTGASKVTWTGDNFLEPGELHEDDGFASLFQGQGMTPAQDLIVVTKRLHRTGLDTSYLTEYGNGAAELDTVYGEVCIVATQANATNQPDS